MSEPVRETPLTMQEARIGLLFQERRIRELQTEVNRLQALHLERTKLTTRIIEERDAAIDVIRKCSEPARWHAPCVCCGPSIIEQGCYIARAFLARTKP